MIYLSLSFRGSNRVTDRPVIRTDEQAAGLNDQVVNSLPRVEAIQMIGDVQKNDGANAYLFLLHNFSQ